MRDKIIIIIKNTFKLEKGEEYNKVATMPNAASFEMLKQLLSRLNNRDTSPKELAQILEHLVVTIKLKVDKTPTELEFLKQVQEIIHDPLYKITPQKRF